MGLSVRAELVLGEEGNYPLLVSAGERHQE